MTKAVKLYQRLLSTKEWNTARKAGIIMVANKLKELRRKAGLTLEELADKLGTSKQTIHRYENGIIANIPHEKIKRLAEVLEVSPSELMGWDESIYSYDNLMPIKKKNLPTSGRFFFFIGIRLS